MMEITWKNDNNCVNLLNQGRKTVLISNFPFERYFAFNLKQWFFLSIQLQYYASLSNLIGLSFIVNVC